MKVIGVDTETTGLDQAKGHRIIEIAMVLADIDPTKPEIEVLDKYVQRINPERAIDPDAEAVHKIGISELVGKPTWNRVAPAIVDWMKRGEILVAHNMAFDGPFIAAELMRVGIMPPTPPVFCTMENARWATAFGKYPRLAELCWSLTIDYDRSLAHAAEYDVMVTLKCLHRGLKRNFYDISSVK
jgi:DNA polymerase-3 subunit epsilon